MLINLHTQATTKPKVRAAIEAGDEPASIFSELFGTTEQAVYKSKHRDSVHDLGHTPHRLHKMLTPAQKGVAVALRKTLLVSLDDLLAVVRESLHPNASRSELDRCLRRHGQSNLRDMRGTGAWPKHSAFRAHGPEYIHDNVQYLLKMANETARRYLFVAIDQASHCIFIRVNHAHTAANVRRFLRDLKRACPIRNCTILTNYGKEVKDPPFGLRELAAMDEHEFNTLCVAVDVGAHLTPTKSTQTNDMVEP